MVEEEVRGMEGEGEVWQEEEEEGVEKVEDGLEEEVE